MPFNVALGKKVFNDTRLSYNNTKSCASCHNQYLAFTDGYRTSITAEGEHLSKNAPTLLYLKDNNYFDYSNPKVRSLEQQHLRPLFGKHPIELGTDSLAFLTYVNNDTDYLQLMKSYDIDSVKSMSDIISSIADYVRTLEHYNSPYDRYMAGDSNALTESQIKGMKLFYSKRLNCTGCHESPNFTLLNCKTYSVLFYPTNHWNYDSTQHPIKIPTLRNIAVTGPYLHDGSINTLQEIIDKYNAEYSKMSENEAFSLNEKQKMQLIDFLYALTDDEYKDE